MAITSIPSWALSAIPWLRDEWVLRLGGWQLRLRGSISPEFIKELPAEPDMQFATTGASRPLFLVAGLFSTDRSSGLTWMTEVVVELEEEATGFPGFRFPDDEDPEWHVRGRGGPFTLTCYTMALSLQVTQACFLDALTGQPVRIKSISAPQPFGTGEKLGIQAF